MLLLKVLNLRRLPLRFIGCFVCLTNVCIITPTLLNGVNFYKYYVNNKK
nr:MAG TPA: hypothetical protein [Caudoviricetes sp.]